MSGSMEGTGRRFFIGRKTAIAIGSPHLIARQKAMDGEDVLEAQDELQEVRNHAVSGAFLVTFFAVKK